MELTPTFVEELSRVVVSCGSTFNLQVRMVDWDGAGWHNRPTHLVKGSECKFALTTAAEIQLATPRYFVENWKESFGDPTESMARGDTIRGDRRGNRVGGGQSGGLGLHSEVSVSTWSLGAFLFCTRMRGDPDDDWHWAWSKKYPCVTVVRRPRVFAEQLGIDFGRWLLSENICEPGFELTVDHGAVRYTPYKPPRERDGDWRRTAPWFKDVVLQGDWAGDLHGHKSTPEAR